MTKGDPRRPAKRVTYRDKGTELEERIASYFAQNGYQTARNVVREGRSGARHELDVLASKGDGIVDFSLIVECKAWEGQVDKDVITKLSWIMADLGINKGVVVALRGWTSGAELTATQAGIDLWGTDELRNKLGGLAIAEISAGRSSRTGRGLPIAIDAAAPQARLMRSAWGFLGFGREELIWIKLLWLPFYFVTLDHSRGRQTLLRGQVTQTATRWNLYDGLSGTLFSAFEARPEFQPVDLEVTLPPLTNTRRLQKTISDSIRKAHSVVTAKAQKRHAAHVGSLGVPSDADDAVVTDSELVYLPFICSFLRTGPIQRLSSIDAVWGLRWPHFDAVLSANVSHVLAAVGDAPGPEAAEFRALRRAARPSVVQLLVLGVIAAVEFVLVGSNIVLFAGLFAGTLAVLLWIGVAAWRGNQ